MANLLWNEAAPQDTDSVGQGDDEIRSLKTSVRNGMAEEHLWPSASGGNFGVHLLGSARPYYGPQSLVSSVGTDGRLMVTSDTSRLFHVGSAGTMFLGGQNALSAGSSPVGGQRFYWAIEFGTENPASQIHVVTFPNSGFSGAPFVSVSAQTQVGTRAIFPVARGITGATMTVDSWLTDFATRASGHSLTWFSIGTRTL